MGKKIEIRDPIHGFIELDEWERDIINHPVFQRLRRIRQLAWTDMVYPGACHTRFEHSLGVMHVASRMYDRIVSDEKCKAILRSELDYQDAGLERNRKKVRLACLLHDVGHPPFSHAGEKLFPKKTGGSRYKHEEYSAAIIRYLMEGVIDNHPSNIINHGLHAKDIADFVSGKTGDSGGIGLFWRELLDSQLDADRADYLLRDSHHMGVTYGHFDLPRLLVTITIGQDRGTGTPKLAIDKSGMHAAEALIIARYLMFTQVYFQHTRRAYDHLIESAVREMILSEQARIGVEQTGCFPPPTSLENVEAYLKWTDWKVLGMLNDGAGGECGEMLRSREHHRCVWHTPESPQQTDFDKFDDKVTRLGNLVSYIDNAQKAMYKVDMGDEIQILTDSIDKGPYLKPLSQMSKVILALKEAPIQQKRIYVSLADKEESKKRISTFRL